MLVPYPPSLFVFCLPPASNLLALTPAAIRKPERRSPDGKREGEASVVAVKRGKGTKGVQYAYCSLPRPTGGKAEGVTYTASVCKFACFNLCLWRRWCLITESEEVGVRRAVNHELEMTKGIDG